MQRVLLFAGAHDRETTAGRSRYSADGLTLLPAEESPSGGSLPFSQRFAEHFTPLPVRVAHSAFGEEGAPDRGQWSVCPPDRRARLQLDRV